MASEVQDVGAWQLSQEVLPGGLLSLEDDGRGEETGDGERLPLGPGIRIGLSACRGSTTRAESGPSTGVAERARVSAPIVAVYEETTELMAEISGSHPAACNGSTLKGPVGIHHTRGMPPAALRCGRSASSTGPTTTSHNQPSVSASDCSRPSRSRSGR